MTMRTIPAALIALAVLGTAFLFAPSARAQYPSSGDGVQPVSAGWYDGGAIYWVLWTDGYGNFWWEGYPSPGIR